MNKKIFSLVIGCLALSATPINAQTSDAKYTITDASVEYPECVKKEITKSSPNWFLDSCVIINESKKGVVKISDSEYKSRLNELQSTIELPFNSVVKKHIKYYTEDNRQFISRMLGLSTHYMPIFEKALDERGLPEELKYLPILESALNTQSKADDGDAGLWKLSTHAATGNGLELTSITDERLNPVKSSRVAAIYLQQLYDVFGDWGLAITAFNYGHKNLAKTILRAGGGKKSFWEIYHLLPKEVRSYYPSFIAINYAMYYYKEHNIGSAVVKNTINTDTATINKRVHFKQISEVLNIPVSLIEMLNPQYRKQVIPGNAQPCILALPSKQIFAYQLSEDSIVNHEIAKYKPQPVVEVKDVEKKYTEKKKKDKKLEQITYTVKKGDKLDKIAKKYGVTVNDIKKWNKNIKNINKLKVGQKLKIYPKKSADSKKDKEKNKKKKTKTKTHKVKKGESLSRIAKKYGVTVNDIKKANKLKKDDIKPGQTLKIPAKK